MIHRVHFREIPSTNDYAKELSKSNSIVVVTADVQTQGRGRNKKNWEGEAFKNVYLSLAINHNSFPVFKFPSRYQALGSLAVYNTLLNFIPSENIKLKYPNDIYIKENKFKKVSGVLIEHSIQGKKAESTIIGIGINVKQEIFSKDIEDKATSILKVGLNIEIETLYKILIEEINKLINLEEDDIYQDWICKLSIIGKEIILISTGFKYKVKEINNDCSLMILNEQKELLRIDNGDSIVYEL